MKRGIRVLSAAAATGMIVAAIAAPSGASSARAHASACVKVSNIEAIIDDSGSMAITDSSTLRVKGVKLLINTLSSGTFLGAVEFGGSFFGGSTPSADTVFKPEAVAPHTAPMAAAPDPKIIADNGGPAHNSPIPHSHAANPKA